MATKPEHRQKYTEERFELRLNNDKQAFIPFADVRALYDSVNGAPSDKRTIVREWMKEQMRLQLGNDDFERVFRECDYDVATGWPMFVIVTA